MGAFVAVRIVVLGVILATTSSAVNAQSAANHADIAVGVPTTHHNRAPVSPLVSGDRCNIRGYVPSPAPYQELAGNQTLGNIYKCFAYCLHRIGQYKAQEGSPEIETQDGCKNVGFDESTGLCSLYTGHLRDMGFRRNDSGSTAFYSVRCLNHQPQCPHRGTDNLLDNGGFERSQVYAGPWNVTCARGNCGVTNPGNDGSLNSLGLLGTPEGEFASVYQYRNLCSGQLYTFTADIKLLDRNPGPKTALVETQIFVGEWYILSPFQTPSDGWRTYMATLLSSGGLDRVKMLIRSVGNGPGHILVDNVTLRPTREAFQTKDPNLVTNGDFETGSLQPWQFDGRVISPGLTGDYALKLPYSKAPGRRHEKHINQPVVLKPGTKYLFTFDYRVAEFFGFGTSVCYNEWEEKSDAGFAIPQNVTQTFQRMFIAQDMYCNLGISFDRYKSSPGETSVIIDNVSIYELA